MGARRAILIGNGRFESTSADLLPLDGPQNDLAELARLLGDPRRGAFEVEALLDRTSQDLRERLNEVLDAAATDDTILIYFSGHGKLGPLGDLCLAAANTRVDRLRATSLEIAFLKSLIDGSRCQCVVVLLDCCFSGAAEKSFSRSGADDSIRRISGEGCYVLTSSTATQTSREREVAVDGCVMGQFTRAVVDGIRSSAADLNGDGEITLRELTDHVMGAVRGQDPCAFARAASGNVLISRCPLPSKLPDELLRLAQGESQYERIGAVDQLARLARSDAHVRELTLAQLAVLARDPDRSVFNAAFAALDGLLGAGQAELVAAVRARLAALARDADADVSARARAALDAAGAPDTNEATGRPAVGAVAAAGPSQAGDSEAGEVRAGKPGKLVEIATVVVTTALVFAYIGAKVYDDFRARNEPTHLQPATSPHAATVPNSGDSREDAPGPRLTIESPGTRYLGRPVPLALRMTNPDDFESVINSITATAGVELQPIEADAPGRIDGRCVKWTEVRLAPRGETVIRFVLRGVAAGAAQVEIEALGCTPAYAKVPIQIVGIASVLLEVVDINDPVELGTDDTYEISITNQGSAAETNLRLSVPLPPELEFVSGAGATDARLVGGVVRFATLPTLAPKARATYRLVVKCLKAGDVRLSAELRADSISTPFVETEMTRVYGGE